MDVRDPAPSLPRAESLGLQPAAREPGPLPGSTEVAVPRPAAPAWTAPVPSLLHQVESGIRWMLRNASPGAELQLHPEALGRVRIELKVEGGEVHARMWASDPKSIPVLQENRAFLEVSLREQGLNLGSFDLRQQSQHSQPQLPGERASGQFWPSEAPAQPRQEPPIQPTPSRGNPRRIELIA